MVSKFAVIAMVTVALTLAACTASTAPAPRSSLSSTTASGTMAMTSTSRFTKIPVTMPDRQCSDGDLVDVTSHVRFAPVRVLCIGAVSPGSGVVIHGDLYVVASPTTERLSAFRLLKINLSSYQVVRSLALHGNLSAPVAAFGAVWIVNSSTDDSSQSVLEFSESNLRLLKQIPVGYDAVALGSWFWSLAVGGELERLDPKTGVSATVPLDSLPPHLTITGIAVSGSSLLLSTVGPQPTDSETVVFQPGLGVKRQVPAPDAVVENGDQVIAATRDVVWVIPPGMMVHSVSTLSARTLQRIPAGFQQAGPNGTWIAVLGAGDLWFESGGTPLLCVSGVSGLQSGALRLHGSLRTQDLVAVVLASDARCDLAISPVIEDFGLRFTAGPLPDDDPPVRIEIAIEGGETQVGRLRWPPRWI
jgi:hypothetical protein